MAVLNLQIIYKHSVINSLKRLWIYLYMKSTKIYQFDLMINILTQGEYQN